jgi:hypothetical protein
MDSFEKWQFGKTLSINEAHIILKELFNGAKKHFNFDSKTKIDNNLYFIYENFEDTITSNFVVSFSTIKTPNTFISFNKFDDLKPNHKIILDCGELYIYNHG